MQTDRDLALQRLISLLFDELTLALAQKDWEAMRECDSKISRLLVEMAKDTDMSEALLDQKLRLKQLHKRALDTCAQACEAARLELLRQLQYAEARSAYMHTDMYS